MFLRRLLLDQSGSAAEFALVLPVATLFVFGIIDGGRYMWEVNRAEKATQAGARAAASTAMIPAGLITYSFAVTNGIPQGAAVPAADFPGVNCTGVSATSAPTCTPIATPRVTLTMSPNLTSFNRVLSRMQVFMPGLRPQDVTVSYLNSGLGFAGDPNGPDIAPLIRVQLNNVQFRPILTSWFGVTWGVPASPYSISQEDGQGACYEEIC